MQKVLVSGIGTFGDYASNVTDLSNHLFSYDRSIQSINAAGRKYPWHSECIISALKAGREAMYDSFDSNLQLRNNTNLLLATTSLGWDTFSYCYRRSRDAKLSDGVLSNIPLFSYSRALDLLRKKFSINKSGAIFSSACASAGQAIGYAFERIKSGFDESCLVIGMDSVTEFPLFGFKSLRSLSDTPCKPFAANRNGIHLSAGSAALVLESEFSLKRRNATAYAEIIGFGQSCDANHMTKPNATGIAQAIRSAICDANITIDEIDYIDAHATGTPANDLNEGKAIFEVFGNSLSKSIPVGAIKSAIGHTQGASGAFGMISACIALAKSSPPPIKHSEDIDTNISLNILHKNGLKSYIKTAIVNCFGFGGVNTSVIIRGTTK